MDGIFEVWRQLRNYLWMLFRFAREWGESRGTCPYPTGCDLNRYLTGWTPMFVTQRYTIHHAFQNLCEFIGHIFQKNGEIRARKRVEYRV